VPGENFTDGHVKLKPIIISLVTSIKLQKVYFKEQDGL
jgi:hypothetical protein